MAWIFKTYMDSGISNTRMSFYVVLPSNSCPRTRLDNNASKYLVDYENAINLKDDRWEVAMTEFVFNYCPQTIRKGSKITYKTKVVNEIEDKFQLSIVGGNMQLHNPVPINKYDWYILFEEKKLILKTDCQVEIEFNSLEDAKKFGFNSVITKNKKSLVSIIDSDEQLKHENIPKVLLKLKFSIIEEGKSSIKEIEDSINLEIKMEKLKFLD